MVVDGIGVVAAVAAAVAVGRRIGASHGWSGVGVILGPPDFLAIVVELHAPVGIVRCLVQLVTNIGAQLEVGAEIAVEAVAVGTVERTAVVGELAVAVVYGTDVSAAVVEMDFLPFRCNYGNMYRSVIGLVDQVLRPGATCTEQQRGDKEKEEFFHCKNKNDWICLYRILRPAFR